MSKKGSFGFKSSIVSSGKGYDSGISPADKLLQSTGIEEDIYKLNKQTEVYADPSKYVSDYANELKDLGNRVLLKFNKYYNKYRLNKQGKGEQKTMEETDKAAAGDKDALPPREAREMAYQATEDFFKREKAQLKKKYPQSFKNESYATDLLKLKGTIKQLAV